MFFRDSDSDFCLLSSTSISPSIVGNLLTFRVVELEMLLQSSSWVNTSVLLFYLQYAHHQGLELLVVPGKNTSTKLLTSIMNCSFFMAQSFQRIVISPLFHSYESCHPSLIELLQVADYGLHIGRLVNPDCRSLRVADPEVLEDEEHNLSTNQLNSYARFLSRQLIKCMRDFS